MSLHIGSFFRKTYNKIKAELSNVKLSSIIIGSVIMLGLGFAVAVTVGNKEVYSMLKLPAFAPPSFVFPIVWTIIYLLIGFSGTVIFVDDEKRNETVKYKGLFLFIIGAGLNLIWYPLFFGGGYYLLACIDLTVLLCLSVKTAIIFSKMKLSSAIAMVIYCIWLLFALCLNIGIVSLN